MRASTRVFRCQVCHAEMVFVRWGGRSRHWSHRKASDNRECFLGLYEWFGADGRLPLECEE